MRGRVYAYTIRYQAGQSLDADLYLLVQLEKWRKIEGRYGKDQF